MEFLLINIAVFVLIKEGTDIATLCEQDWTSYGFKADITILSSVHILCVTTKGSSANWDVCPLFTWHFLGHVTSDFIISDIVKQEREVVFIFETVTCFCSHAVIVVSDLNKCFQTVWVALINDDL